MLARRSFLLRFAAAPRNRQQPIAAVRRMSNVLSRQLNETGSGEEKASGPEAIPVGENSQGSIAAVKGRYLGLSTHADLIFRVFVIRYSEYLGQI
jgi:hypothetical protein